MVEAEIQKIISYLELGVEVLQVIFVKFNE